MMKAVQVTAKGGASEVVADRAKPSIADGHDVIVKIEATALNPVDWKMMEYGFFVETWPHVFGCDMAGTVEQVGPEVTSFQVGDKVWAYTDLGKPHSGTFAEYVKVPEQFLGRVPENMSIEEASTLGVGSLTAAFGCDALALEQEKGKTVVVYGASSSVGLYMVQLATKLGHRVIAVASEKNHSTLQQLGAISSVDYKTDNWREEVVKLIPEGATTVCFDAIATTQTLEDCCYIMKQAKGGPVAATSAPIRESQGITVIPVDLGTAYTSNPKGLESWVPRITDLALVPNPVRLVPGGLEGVAGGLTMLKEGRNSGEKVVVRIA